MKMLLGFFIGTTFALVLVLVITHNTSGVYADSPPPDSTSVSMVTPTPTPTPSDTLDINGLMPDIKQIYHAALGGPYRQVEGEITDPSISAYFHKVMDDTGLDKVGAR